MKPLRPAVVAVLVGALLGGCGHDRPEPSTPTAAGAARLLAALGHVGDSEATRERFAYSDVAGMAAVTGDGWADLRFAGAPDVTVEVVRKAGLPIDRADYVITAGSAPRHVIVIAGGQGADTTAAALERLGWSADGGRYRAPAMTAKSPDVDNAGGLIPVGQAVQSGPDLLVGAANADLADAAPAAGRPTLAAVPEVAALAGCLGDVVAAQGRFRARPAYLGTAATGVRYGPKPRVVLCAAHESDAAAEQTAATLRDALAHDDYNGVPFAQLYREASVTVPGGPQHLVRLEATAATPDTMLYQFGGYGLPGERGQGRV